VIDDGLPPFVDDLSDIKSVVSRAPEASSLHAVGIDEVVSGRGAVKTLGEVLVRLGLEAQASVVVLSDTIVKYSDGVDVLEIVRTVLAGTYRLHEVQVAAQASATVVHADEPTVAGAVRRVAELAPRLLVTVGSGTMADIGKVVARDLDLQHVVVQTAASVNGFADDQSVLLINGVKRTTPSRWPDALVVDTTVLANAPLSMTRSGLGDQMSMFTAAADWYLSGAVGFDRSYSPTLVGLMRRDFDGLAQRAADLGQGDSLAIGALAAALTTGGIAMGVAGRTAPSSGTEHVVSHLLEMSADSAGRPTSSHGSTVGVTSVLAALAWQRVRERLRDGGAAVIAPGDDVRDRVERAFGPLDASGATALECWTAYERKLNWIREHLDDLAVVMDCWSVHDEVVGELLVSGDTLAATLRAAQAPFTFAQLEPAPERDVVTWAVANCHLMRDRFTIVDLADLIGAWGASDVAELLDELDRLG
jgi:glycerol-1-phosphate dehydrogenase [NAD(P)+]